MRDDQIAIGKIAPYIRFVNDVSYGEGLCYADRIIYDHEFIFLLDGSAIAEYNGEKYHLTRSNLLYLRPNVVHHLEVEPGGHFRAHCVHFDWFPIDERLNFTAEQLYIFPRNTDEERAFIEQLKQRPAYEISDFYLPTLLRDLDYDVIAPLFQELYYYFCRHDLRSQLRQRALFLQIISELLGTQLTGEGVVRNHSRQKTISDAIRYMQAHFSEPITTPLLAAKTGLSPKYFGVLFKEMTGMAVHDYLLDIRIREAKRLLLSSPASLAEISQMVGIDDVFYFTKLFKRHEGITPGKYRRMLSDLPR